MVRNEGTVDRVVRVVVGIVLVAAWAFGWLTGVLAVVLGVVGIVLIGTGATGFCALYRVFGMSTCPVPTKR
ncbi:MAG: YgaP-like transmembrane domain [Trueperaceae bacterium]